MTPRSTPPSNPAPDPWLDAQHIAQRLKQPGAELLVAVGAEAWCGKCQALRPAFEALCAAQAPAHCVWLWLDLEEHAEFLGDFVPEDLPVLLRWRDGRPTQQAVLVAIDRALQPPGQLRPLPTPGDMPDLWRVFTTPNWEGAR